LLKTALRLACENLVDVLPDALRNDYCLMRYLEAVRQIHFPQNAGFVVGSPQTLDF
jgi:RecG-like helicase